MTLLELLTPQYGNDASKMLRYLTGYDLEAIQTALPVVLAASLVFPGNPKDSAIDIKRAVRKASNSNQISIAW